MKKNNWNIYILLCLSLGLAPWWINGEPHIIGKIKWVAGGGAGMKGMDYFDLLMHGAPWILLLGKIVYTLVKKR